MKKPKGKYVCLTKRCGAPLELEEIDSAVSSKDIDPETGEPGTSRDPDLETLHAMVFCSKDRAHKTGWLGVANGYAPLRDLSGEAEAIQKEIVVIGVCSDENEAISAYVNSNAGFCESDRMKKAFEDVEDSE